MANAFPMVARSFEAQYRGLTEAEKEWLQHTAVVRVDHVVQRVQQLWTVEYRWGPIFLLCFKDDMLL